MSSNDAFVRISVSAARQLLRDAPFAEPAAEYTTEKGYPRWRVFRHGESGDVLVTSSVMPAPGYLDGKTIKVAKAASGLTILVVDEPRGELVPEDQEY